MDAQDKCDKTIATCEQGLRRIEQQHKRDTQVLNNTFRKIGLAVVHCATRDAWLRILSLTIAYL